MVTWCHRVTIRGRPESIVPKSLSRWHDAPGSAEGVIRQGIATASIAPSIAPTWRDAPPPAWCRRASKAACPTRQGPASLIGRGTPGQDNAVTVRTRRLEDGPHNRYDRVDPGFVSSSHRPEP